MIWIKELWSTYKIIKQIQETGNRVAPWLGDYILANAVITCVSRLERLK